MDIVYHDEHLIAINKPEGLLVHRSLIDRHETQFALQMVRDHIGQHVYPVHRLDKPTSGTLLFAKDRDTARRLTELFTGNQVSKTYLAVVRGYTQDMEVIDHPLKEELDKMTDSRARQDKPAQSAITEYCRLATVELPYAVGRYTSARYSLVRVSPLTGRKHQIRRHMKHIFHPIIGDTSYGDGRHNQLFRTQFDCRRLLLAATQLELAHPVSGQQVKISAGLDQDFLSLCVHLGWQEAIPDLGGHRN